MTSSVKITAHCAKTKHVRVIITNPDADGPNQREEFYLNDGEHREVSINDRRVVHTMEEEKTAEQLASEEPKKEPEGAKPKGKKSTPAKDEPVTPDAAAANPDMSDDGVTVKAVTGGEVVETGPSGDSGAASE